ncbi:MAG: phenylalanine--tRNA ligase subunit beta [Firmicutes bacterium]|nr:phenylalanine--tRNA ligase subunit beta [Candidatus Fermentithermobacillaceae bacterium]
MKVPWKWLMEYCRSPWSVEETAERLTMVGVSVENVVHDSFEGKGLITAKVVSVFPHPQRPGLSVGYVDAGGRRYAVVSGAPGFKPGVVTAFAPPGSKLPRKGSQKKQGPAEDDSSRSGPEALEVLARDVHGVLSEGMVLSANEILTGEGPRPGEDILIFPEGTASGLPLDEFLDLDDYVLELDLTPNFSHCLSIIGVAVELSAISGVPVRLPKTLASWSFLDPAGSLETGDDSSAAAWEGEGPRIEVVLEDPDLCPHYVGKVIRDVKWGYSPIQVERRLYLAGMRPINALVDATNYAMLETGQPLHAFDLDKLAGGVIQVRRSRPGESIVTLDGVVRELPPESLVIADARGPVAIAGIMGGKETEVSETTRNVFLESAWFSPRSVRATSMRLGLRTEALIRFEKGVDPTAQVACVERAAELITRVSGGTPLPGWSRARAFEPPRRKTVLDLRYLEKVLGQSMEKDQVEGILRRLGFSVQDKDGDLEVSVPPRRVDVAEQVDLIEEVARHLGYGSFLGQPLNVTVSPNVPAVAVYKERLRDFLRCLGGSEVVTNSLCGPDDIAAMGWEADDPRANPVKLENPLTSDESLLRTSLLPGLLKGLETNKRYKAAGTVIWEIGTVFFPSKEELPLEKLQLAIAAYGVLSPKTWNAPPLEADFYYMKGLVQSLLEGLGVDDVTVEKRAGMPFHPGRSCKVLSKGVTLGEMGEVHPLVLEKYGLDRRTALAWFDVEALRAMSREPRYQPVPRFPRVERDLAVIAPEELEAGAIERLVRREAKHLVGFRVFDLWKGAPVPAGKKSIAFSMIFGAPDRTLTDDEVTLEIQKIVRKLEEELNVTLR